MPCTQVVEPAQQIKMMSHTQSTFLDIDINKETKLKITNEQISYSSPNVWEQSNMLQNIPWIKEEKVLENEN